MAAYGFSEDGARRIADAVRKVEGVDARQPAEEWRWRQPFNWVRVTSIDSGDQDAQGRYPAQWLRYNAADNTWSDGGPCWALGMNGSPLALAKYPAYLAGAAAAPAGSSGLWGVYLAQEVNSFSGWRLKRTSNQAITQGLSYFNAVVWESSDYDTDDYWDDTDLAKIVIPEAGKYLIGGQTVWGWNSPLPSASIWQWMDFFRNPVEGTPQQITGASESYGGCSWNSPFIQSYYNLNASFSANLDQGDILKMGVRWTSSFGSPGTANICGGGYYNSVSYFWGQYLG